MANFDMKDCRLENIKKNLKKDFKNNLEMFFFPSELCPMLSLGSGLFLILPEKIIRKIHLTNIKEQFGHLITYAFIISLFISLFSMVYYIYFYLSKDKKDDLRANIKKIKCFILGKIQKIIYSFLFYLILFLGSGILLLFENGIEEQFDTFIGGIFFLSLVIMLRKTIHYLFEKIKKRIYSEYQNHIASYLEDKKIDLEFIQKDIDAVKEEIHKRHNLIMGCVHNIKVNELEKDKLKSNDLEADLRKLQRIKSAIELREVVIGKIRDFNYEVLIFGGVVGVIVGGFEGSSENILLSIPLLMFNMIVIAMLLWIFKKILNIATLNREMIEIKNRQVGIEAINEMIADRERKLNEARE